METKEPKEVTVDNFKKLTDGIFRKLLALIVLYFILGFLFDIGTKAFDEEKWDILLMIITVFINTLALLIGFYYASTQSSQDKDKRISEALNGGTDETP